MYYIFRSLLILSFLAVGLVPSDGSYLSAADITTALTHNLSTVDVYTNNWGSQMRYGFNPIHSLTAAAIKHGVTNVSCFNLTFRRVFL